MTKVLVIEDDNGVRDVIMRLLHRRGYEVVGAAFGQDGYGKAASEKPHMILLDLMMPVMDGFEVLRKLKSNPATMSIPVIILTAKIDAESERRCMRDGALDYVHKPWGPGEIEDRIAIALGRREIEPTDFNTVKFRPNSEARE